MRGIRIKESTLCIPEEGFGRVTFVVYMTYIAASTTNTFRCEGLVTNSVGLALRSTGAITLRVTVST